MSAQEIIIRRQAQKIKELEATRAGIRPDISWFFDMETGTEHGRLNTAHGEMRFTRGAFNKMQANAIRHSS